MGAGKINRIDKYEILEQIGSGGMGAVYKALHPQFKKYVAIKEIRSELAANPDIQQRFEREAQLLAQLPPHPNIVTVRDALVWGERLYLVIDYIDGGTLKDAVKQSGVSVKSAAVILDQLLSGLDAIHSRGIAHRDLKSSNILIDREGMVFISDFGIAESVALPAKAKVMVTPRYAAPEIIDPSLGRFGTEYQSDIYAAGFVAYEMLLGETRFRESFPEVYTRLQGSEAERWLNWHTDLTRSASNLNDIDPQIPRPLAAIVERMMAKNVKERYQSASDARQNLAAWMWDDGDQARRRRTDQDQDDATLPVDRIRPQGATRHSTGRLRPKVTSDRQAYVESGQSKEFKSEPPEPPPAKPLARWQRGWLVAVAAMILVAAVILVSAIGGQPGFTLIVRGAARASVVYIDNKRVGVPTTEDTIKVFGLRAGVPLTVRVFYEGGECQLSPNIVTGADGKPQYVDAQCAVTLPEEINYGGPMVLVPNEGEFLMGDNNHLADEKPQHLLAIPGYYIDKYEVTNEQYRKFCHDKQWPEPTGYALVKQLYDNNPNYPVIGISWDDAVAYAEWAKKRLPTEAEWEKAASWESKARTKRLFPWGDNPEMNRARLAKDQPASIFEYESDVSPYRVRGMGGNASEWVSDLFDHYKQDSAPNPDFNNGHRVVRGGSFNRKDIEQSRTTFRGHQPHDLKASEAAGTAIGLRCAISADDPRLRQYLREHGFIK